MNFTAYIQSQKTMIRRRGSAFMAEDGSVSVVPSREKLLSELDGIKGLNVEDRERYARLARRR